MKSFHLRRPLDRRTAAALRRQPGGIALSRDLEAGLPAIALGANGALATAILNDKAEPRLLFAQETAALGRRGDVFLGISTSGNARDVLLAMSVARARGLTVITLTGTPGGRMAAEAAIRIRAPGDSVPRIQEHHVRIYHALCAGIEASFWSS
jgi:D-sedoheptulose 7-phosphate isomerase